MAPQWSNVYNRVTVNLHNAEIGGVTQKEIAAANFLDKVCGQTYNQDVEDALNMNEIVSAAQLEHDSLVNDQNKPTSLFKAE